MPKAVMLSIRPRYCEMIAGNFKSIEVRKSRPKIETPFKCYIYCTKPSFEYEDFIALENGRFIYGGGKVIGEFVCDRIFSIEPLKKEPPNLGGKRIEEYSKLGYKDCLTDEDFAKYVGLHNGKTMCGWHISNLVIYDEPKKLTDFIRPSGGCCNEGKCTGCKYLDKGNGYNVEDDCFADFDTDSYSIVTRPPQSWGYVEELT